jgi:hypothetical protein
MNNLVSKQDFEDFANENRIPILFIFDEGRLISPGNYPTFICFDKDYMQIRRNLPVAYALIPIPDQIEYTNERLKIEYSKA